jgi:hypothetical protein
MTRIAEIGKRVTIYDQATLGNGRWISRKFGYAKTTVESRKMGVPCWCSLNVPSLPG